MATRKLTKIAVDTLPIRDRVYIAYDNALSPPSARSRGFPWPTLVSKASTRIVTFFASFDEAYCRA